MHFHPAPPSSARPLASVLFSPSARRSHLRSATHLAAAAAVCTTPFAAVFPYCASPPAPAAAAPRLLPQPRPHLASSPIHGRPDLRPPHRRSPRRPPRCRAPPNPRPHAPVLLHSDAASEDKREVNPALISARPAGRHADGRRPHRHAPPHPRPRGLQVQGNFSTCTLFKGLVDELLPEYRGEDAAVPACIPRRRRATRAVQALVQGARPPQAD